MTGWLVVDAVQYWPGVPRHALDRVCGYPARRYPRHRAGDWIIRYDSGAVAVCGPAYYPALRWTDERKDQ